MEHPEGPGSEPFQSIFATDQFRATAERADWETVSFPQCSLGAASQKPTTLAGSRRLNMEKHFGGLRCTHKKHGVELIGKDEMGQFKTKQAQS